jgi:UDP-glucose 4-epimerase
MKYLITGGSGYIGGRLIDLLTQRGDSEVVNLDLRPPAAQRPGTRFVQMDVRDRGMRALIESERPDALIHLAFVLNPIRDEHKMYDIDVNGTENVLSAASAAGVEQLLVASSTTAYGAFPDNPVPLTEEDPVRGLPGYEYARDKTEIDRLCQLWAAQHPDSTMTIVRPTIVFGPNVDNYIVRTFINNPFFPVLDGVEEEFQLVHEDDVVSALFALLDGKKAGAFNLAGDGLITWKQASELLGKKTRELSLKSMKRFAGAMWRMHVPRTEAPPGNLDFIRYPWVVSTEKLKAETDWKPRFDTLETFKITMRAKGVLESEPSAVQTPTAPVA